MRHDEQNNESMLPHHLVQTTRDFYTILLNNFLWYAQFNRWREPATGNGGY